VAKVTKNKKSKEGRHVGLDFYDLLIESLTDPDGGFRRFGHPPRRRICLQCQLGNLHTCTGGTCTR